MTKMNRIITFSFSCYSSLRLLGIFKSLADTSDCFCDCTSDCNHHRAGDYFENATPQKVIS